MEVKISKGAYERIVTVDLAAMPGPSIANVFSIGFRNLPALPPEAFEQDGSNVVARVPMADLAAAGLHSILNDAHASVKADDPQAASLVDAAVDKKLAALMSGTVRVGGGGGRVADPVRRRAILIAMPWAKAALVKAGTAKPEDKQVRAKAIEMVKANPAFMSLAVKQLDDERELGIENVDADE